MRTVILAARQKTEFVRPRDLQSGEVVSSFATLSEIKRFLRKLPEEKLREVPSILFSESIAKSLAHSKTEDLLERISHLLIIKSLVVVEKPLPVINFVPRFAEDFETLDDLIDDSPVKKTTTFIEIILLDTNKKPFVNERYILTDSRGDMFRGQLDKNGFARVEPVATGEASVVFPDFNQTNAVVKTPLTYVEFDLLGQDQKLRAGESFIVIASDGKEFHGKLNDKGHGRVDDIALGEATVLFPDLEKTKSLENKSIKSIDSKVPLKPATSASFVVYTKNGGTRSRASGQITAKPGLALLLDWEIDSGDVTGVGISFGKKMNSVRDVTSATKKVDGKWKGSMEITPTSADINTPEGIIYIELIVEPAAPDAYYGAVNITLKETAELAITKFEAITPDGSQKGNSLDVPRNSDVYLAWNVEGATDVEIYEDAGNGKHLLTKISAMARTLTVQPKSNATHYYLTACFQDRSVESQSNVQVNTAGLEDLLLPPLGVELLPPWNNKDGAGTWTVPLTPKALTDFISKKLKLEKKNWKVPGKDPWATINLSATIKPTLAVRLTSEKAKKFGIAAPTKPPEGSTAPEINKKAELKTDSSLFKGIEAKFTSVESWDIDAIMGKGQSEWGIKANFNPLGFIKWASTTDYNGADKLSKFAADKIEDTVADISMWYKLSVDAPAQWGDSKGTVQGSLEFKLNAFKLKAGKDIVGGKFGFKLPDAAALGQLAIVGSFLFKDVIIPLQVEGTAVDLVGNVIIELKGTVEPDWASIIERAVKEEVANGSKVFGEGLTDIALRFALSDAGLCLGAPLAVGAGMLWVFAKESQAWDDFTNSLKTLHDWQEKYPNGVRDGLFAGGTKKPSATPPVTPYDTGLHTGNAFWDQYYKQFWENLANGDGKLFPDKAKLLALSEEEKRKILLTVLYNKGYFEKTVADARSSAEYVVRARIYLGYCAAHPYPPEKTKRDLTFRSIYADVVCPSDYTKFVSPGFPAEVLESALRDAWYMEQHFEFSKEALEYNLEGLLPHIIPEEFTKVQETVKAQPAVIKDKANGYKMPNVVPKMNRTLGNVKPEKGVTGRLRYDPTLAATDYKDGWPWPSGKVYTKKIHNLEGVGDTSVDVQLNKWYAENGAPYPWPAQYQGQFHAMYPLAAAKKLAGKA